MGQPKADRLTSLKVDDPWRAPLSHVQKPDFVALIPALPGSSTSPEVVRLTSPAPSRKEERVDPLPQKARNHKERDPYTFVSMEADKRRKVAQFDSDEDVANPPSNSW